ncbi:hypothetical protein L202_07671 [Cryptococcus amylolentus CBS 6039]|uniref:Uncharacterized protein n=1 Tax=Cryptococcus amylolentus CBS 6039 TaxID=1295533 RepID=A0A1E3HEP0_9TREE|nr:hypothetical protein L202_07671 [Cryptococcus amylolentus CBS 6039]ODN74226.1 hypothetical protein L202_07671 [Cryptococcus amylolentus CBS 6039]
MIVDKRERVRVSVRCSAYKARTTAPIESDSTLESSICRKGKPIHLNLTDLGRPKSVKKPVQKAGAIDKFLQPIPPRPRTDAGHQRMEDSDKEEDSSDRIIALHEDQDQAFVQSYERFTRQMLRNRNDDEEDGGAESDVEGETVVAKGMSEEEYDQKVLRPQLATLDEMQDLLDTGYREGNQKEGTRWGRVETADSKWSKANMERQNVTSEPPISPRHLSTEHRKNKDARKDRNVHVPGGLSAFVGAAPPAPVPQKKRGRPPKAKGPSEAEPVPKKKRGRPRKNPIREDPSLSVPSAASSSALGVPSSSLAPSSPSQPVSTSPHPTSHDVASPLDPNLEQGSDSKEGLPGFEYEGRGLEYVVGDDFEDDLFEGDDLNENREEVPEKNPRIRRPLAELVKEIDEIYEQRVIADKVQPRLTSEHKQAYVQLKYMPGFMRTLKIGRLAASHLVAEGSMEGDDSSVCEARRIRAHLADYERLGHLELVQGS